MAHFSLFVPGTPMSERNFPASFWDQNHNFTAAAAAAAASSSSSRGGSCGGAYADLYSTDQFHAASGLTGALTQLAASCSDWPYSAGANQQGGASGYGSRSSAAAAAYNYPRLQSGVNNYWAAARSLHAVKSEWSQAAAASSDYHQAAQAAAAVALTQHHAASAAGASAAADFSHHYGAAAAAHHYSNITGKW